MIRFAKERSIEGPIIITTHCDAQESVCTHYIVSAEQLFSINTACPLYLTIYSEYYAFFSLLIYNNLQPLEQSGAFLMGHPDSETYAKSIPPQKIIDIDPAIKLIKSTFGFGGTTNDEL